MNRGVVKLNVPGDWRDAWLYKGTLLLWSRHGKIFSLSLDRIAKEASRSQYPGVAAALRYAILRNDWKVSSAFRELMEVPDIRKAFMGCFDDADGVLEISIEAEPWEMDGSENLGYVYDTCIYANRIYQATSDGLFESLFNPEYSEDLLELSQSLDFATFAVTARYMCVNASAKERGLWFSPVVLGPKNSNSTSVDALQVADYSAYASFAGRNLLNYTEDRAPSFLKAHDVKMRATDNAQYEEYVVTGFDDEVQIASLAGKAVNSRKKITFDGRSGDDESEQVEVIGNSNHRLLVASGEGVTVVNIAAFSGSGITMMRDRSFRVPLDSLEAGEILSTSPLKSGFVVEKFDSVDVVTHHGAFEIYNKPVGRVRTFGKSLRHQDVVAVTGETSMSLLGFVDFGDSGPQF
ncbi:hypothetical protein [Streptomyces sp. NPDC099088]|uniref:hypothetical protein n=1 Tax=Streptomyces sp. NPDC099088 TaxID=3366101 RepID=UPI0037F5373B